METMLIIDDEKPILNMFSLLLNLYGYRVFTAENGEDGLDVFKKEKPDVVFLDVKMPGMDGLTVLKEIKAVAPETEVIIVTGHGDEDLAQSAFALNADDFINKPFQKESLDEALDKWQKRLKDKESS